MLLDTNTDFGAHVEKRLREDLIIWLTTVRADGTPQPNPVWFLWEKGNFLVYTQPGARRLQHIAGNPKVSINLECDKWGGEVAIFTGEAQVDPQAPPVNMNEAYIEKYREGIADIGMTPDSMAHSYSVAIRITPNHLRGF